MERQCRLCFETDEPTPFVSPCNCRGTQAYIHTHCLALYFQHFPDGICRVCRVRLRGVPEDEWIYGLALGLWTVNLIYASTLPRDVREMYLLLVSGVILWMLHAKQLPIAIPSATMIVSSIFLTSSLAIIVNVLSVSVAVFSLFLLGMYVPMQFLLLSMALGLGIFYTFAIVLFALSRTDSLFASILFSAFVYLWYLIVRARPPQRNV